MTVESLVKTSISNGKMPWAPLVLLPIVLFAFWLARGFFDPSPDPLSHMGTDDAMRMVQVLDLKDGAGWYDLTQKRLDPPAGVRMHWSRLPDLPVLAVLTLTEPLMGRERAVRFSAVLVPLLLGIVFFVVFVWAAAPLVDRDALPAAGLVSITLIVTQAQFAPYRIDHHGWQILLAMVGVGAVVRVALRPSMAWPMIGAGLAGALGLWIGAEALAVIALVCAALTLCWVVDGDDRFARDVAVYGTTLVGGVMAVYPLALPIADWGLKACDAFSAVSLGVAVLVLVFGLVLVGLTRGFPRFGVAARLAAGLVVAGVLFASFLLVFPDCAYGPYGKLPAEAIMLMRATNESESVLSALISRPWLAMFVLAVPLSALVLSGWRVFSRRPPERLLWLGLLVFVTGGIVLQCWQLRASALANAFAGVALCGWVVERMRIADAIDVLLLRVLVRSMPLLLLLGLQTGLLVGIKAMTGASEPQGTQGCEPASIVSVLDRLALTESGSLLIATHVNLGPRLLLQTPHRVVVGPYHRNADGLKAIMEIFGSDLKQARRTVEQKGVDLLYVCGRDSKLIRRTTDAPTLYERLQSGDAPDWLTEIPIPAAAEGARLYRVVTP